MPSRPTKEFWDSVFPGVYEQYSSKLPRAQAEDVAKKTTAKIWQKLGTAKKMEFERLRKAREGKRKNPNGPFVCTKCHEPIDLLNESFWASDKGIVHDECRDDKEDADMVNCGVCHKPIKVTRDKHYYDDKTKKRYHLDCIIDVCPTCDKPILLNQKYDRIKGQAFHPACVPSGHVHGDVVTVSRKAWSDMVEAVRSAKMPKKLQKVIEELDSQVSESTDGLKENPIGLASPEDFIAWWSQGLSLGLIKADGKVVQGPSWGRFADWWTHGMTLGIIAVEPELAIEDVDNILDYIVRSFTLGLVSTGGKPSILQMRAEKMTEEGLIPSVALPSLDSSLTDARTNPAEIWADDDLEENPFPLLVPLAMAVAPTVMDTASKAIAPRQTPPAQSPAPATGGAPAPPAGPQPPAQVPSRNNPDVPVHYIITTKEGKVYANTWGTRRQAEQTVRDIFKRTGVETTVLYPDEKQKEVKKFGNVLRRL